MAPSSPWWRRSWCGCCSWCCDALQLLENAPMNCPMNARPGTPRHDNRAARLARAARRSAARLAGKRVDADAHRRPARSGDRAGRPRLPRRQQPEAGRLPGARRWRRLDPARVHDLHMVQSVLALPEHLDVFESGIAVAPGLLLLRPAGRAAGQAGRRPGKHRDRRDPHLPRTVRALLRRPDAARRAGRGAGGRRATATSTPARTPKTRRRSSRPPRSRAAS